MLKEKKQGRESNHRRCIRCVRRNGHDGDPEIFVMNADGTALKKLTDNTAVDAAPSWSPDGGKIVFTSDRGGSFELYRMNADGSRQEMIPTAVEDM